MIDFYEWLKENKEIPYEDKIIKKMKSVVLIGSSECPIRYEYQPITLSKPEVKMIYKMWQYVLLFPEVTDQMFSEMLQDEHLKRFRTLLKEYSPCDGGIASDLRFHGYFPVAYYIVYRRNIDSNFSKAMERPLPKMKESFIEKLKQKMGINKKQNKANNPSVEKNNIKYLDHEDDESSK